MQVRVAVSQHLPGTRRLPIDFIRILATVERPGGCRQLIGSGSHVMRTGQRFAQPVLGDAGLPLRQSPVLRQSKSGPPFEYDDQGIVR